MTGANRRARWLPTVYLMLVFVYLMFPLLVVVPLSFGNEDLLRFPPRALSLRWYEAYFGDPFDQTALDDLARGRARKVGLPIVQAADAMSRLNQNSMKYVKNNHNF